jgi:hypothetical protein
VIPKGGRMRVGGLSIQISKPLVFGKIFKGKSDDESSQRMNTEASSKVDLIIV